MRFRFILVCVGVSIGLGVAGCSNEEPSAPPEKAPKVVRKIVEASAEPGKKEGKNPQGASQPTGDREVSSASSSPEAAPDFSEERKASSSPVVPETESAQAMTGSEAPKASPEESPSASRAEARGVYTVRPGDCLAVIAGREDVLGDPLKWPLLYQLNRGALEDVPLDERLPERRLPQGVQLRFERSEEERSRAESSTDPVWVVNLISSPTADRIDGPAVELMKQGYPVYISRATVKGQKWMRLRVGFFEDRPAAVKAGKELQELLHLEDSWPVRIGPEETAEYAEILMPLQKG